MTAKTPFQTLSFTRGPDWKNRFALAPLTKKPVVAGDAERDDNPRARSAKLRAARRIPREEAA